MYVAASEAGLKDVDGEASLTTLSQLPLPTENLLEDTDLLLPPPFKA